MKTSSKAAKARVLVVEDDIALRESIGMLLETLDYDVTRSRSRMSSLTMLLDNRFDVVLLDLNLGSGQYDGLRVIEAAKKTGISVPPIVIVSGQSSESIRVAAAAIHTEFYVQKPFTAEGLATAIQGALNAH